MITVQGLTELKEKIERLRRWPAIAEEIVTKHLNVIVERAKELAPVDTGFMRDNIRSLGTQITNDLIQGQILSAADYSSFVEFGTKYQHEQPHLRPAVEEELENLISELVNAFEAEFN